MESFEEKRSSSWEKLLPREGHYNDYEYPKVSIILPTHNCSDILSVTLEKILTQSYPNFEVLIIDSSSEDNTLEIIKSFRSDKIHIFSTSEMNRYAQINAGIAQAKGEYLNILFPGDYYLYKNTLTFMMDLALDHQKPPLVFCGTLLRGAKTETTILYRHLSPRLLRQGKQPTSLQACWFKKSLFQEIGKFDTEYDLRGGFDFLCRYTKKLGSKTVSKNRILLDYDLRRVTNSQTITHFKETYKIVKKHFGLRAAIKWLFIQKDLIRLFKDWLIRTRGALLGR